MGQDQPIRLLTTLLRNETTPHALLFIGMEGVGKQSTAITFAKACNCKSHEPERFSEAAYPHSRSERKDIRREEATPCGYCRPCRKISSGHHPDIILVSPSGPFIKIGQIRDLIRTLAMKPYEARLRVVVIADAQAMNPSASNALLKVLEEPPDRTILILTATQTSDLLPTIVSRCQQIRFNPIAKKSIEIVLVDDHGVRPGDAQIISIMANGSLSKALSMTTSMPRTNWVRRRNWLINEVAAIYHKPIASHLAFAEKLSKEKTLLFDSLEVMKTWFRDLIVYRYHPDKMINLDLQDKIQKASNKMRADSLISYIDNIQSVQNNIHANTNLRLSLEVLIMRLARA
ncbi:MAG: DNA polymerase III subunit delta' [Desulfobacterales bacterium]|nr:MAG: DNA polymerase III subunit delta' [Desulfobacterales bacterium]